VLAPQRDDPLLLAVPGFQACFLGLARSLGETRRPVLARLFGQTSPFGQTGLLSRVLLVGEVRLLR
jgi:hypothetical protein